MYECLAKVDELQEGDSRGESVITDKDRQDLQSLTERFHKAMDNDFNTAQALAHLFDTVKSINKGLRLLPERPSTEDVALLKGAAATFRELAGVLGLVQQNPAEVVAQNKARMLADIDLNEEEINSLIDKRNQARAAKDWATSDAVRDQLLTHRIVLKDGPEGTDWEVKK
jgi:cysteinyl-tRNA synthetase